MKKQRKKRRIPVRHREGNENTRLHQYRGSPFFFIGF